MPHVGSRHFESFAIGDRQKAATAMTLVMAALVFGGRDAAPPRPPACVARRITGPARMVASAPWEHALHSDRRRYLIRPDPVAVERAMEIRFVSSLTPEDENYLAPALLNAIATLLDRFEIAYTLRIETTGDVRVEHSHPALNRPERRSPLPA